MARSLRRLRGPGSLVLLVLLLVGVMPMSSVAAADEETVVRVGLMDQPDSMNPFAGFGGAWVIPFTYELLVGNAPDRNGVLPPYFASSWEASNGGQTWTYKIDPEKKWSDGTPATARDAEFTLRYIIDSKGTANELNLGFNSTVYFDGLVGSSADIRALDDQTLQVDLLRPQADPPYFFAFIMPKHVLENIATADAATMVAISADGQVPVVGSGDFVVTDWEAGQYHRMARNPYNPALADAPDEVIFVYYDSADAEATALQAGEIDIALDVPIAALESLKSDPNIGITPVVVPQYTFLAFNTATDASTSSSALADPAFRDALGYALDSQALVDRVRQGYADPALSIVSPSLSGYWEAVEAKIGDGRRTFDIATANAKLEAAGYLDSNGDGIREDKEGKPISLRLMTRADQTDLVQVAQFITDWFKQVGVEISATPLERATLGDKLAPVADGGGDWDLFMRAFWPNPAPSDVLLTGVSWMAGTENWSYWSNPEYDALWKQQDGTVDTTERIGLAADAVALFYADAPQHTLYYTTRVEPHRTDKFTNWIEASVAEIYPDQVLRSLTAVDATTPSASPAASEAPSDSAAPSASAGPSPSGGGSSSTSDGGVPIALVAVIAAAVLVVGFFVLRSRRSA